MSEHFLKSNLLTDSMDTYWSVDGRPTYSKTQAIVWSNGNTNKLRFHWMENTWDHVDFSVNPSMSWNELCALRAKQIREKYSRICLWYSGGYDSLTILDSFVKNNLPIDEIAIYDRRAYYDDGEVAQAIEAAQWYKNNIYPGVIIRHANIDLQHIQNWYQETSNWLDAPGDTIRYTRPYLGIRMNANIEIRRLRDRNDRAEIFGFEKPKLDLYNGMWRTFMSDGTVANTAGSDIVQFYCSHDLPELHVKQVHMGIEFFEQNNLDQHELVHSVQSNKDVFGKNWYKELNVGLGRLEPNNNITANGLQKLVFVQSLSSPQDRKLLCHAKSMNDASYKKYIKGINELKEILTWWDPYTEEFTKLNLVSKFYDVRPAIKDLKNNL